MTTTGHLSQAMLWDMPTRRLRMIFKNMRCKSANQLNKSGTQGGLAEFIDLWSIQFPKGKNSGVLSKNSKDWAKEVPAGFPGFLRI